MRKSAKKQSKIQTIQRTVTSRNVTQDNGMVIQTISGKAIAGFAVNAWWPFVISYDQNQRPERAQNKVDSHVLFQTRTHLH